MKRVWMILGVIVAIGAVIGAVYGLYVLPRMHAVAEPVRTVIIPDHFARYAAEIQRADQMIATQPELFRDGTLVTLQNLQGFFDLPLKQKVRYQQIRAPGDPRDYRKGIHQGIDFYETRRGDPVYAAAPGIVIRIDTNYQPLEKKFRDEMLNKCLTLWNGTPGAVGMPSVEEPYGNVLDKLSGRQVLVYHGKNAQNEPIISLYAHLLEVNPELAVDSLVTPDTMLGSIGNSGTSGEVEKDPKKENHLHIELFVGEMYWTPKTPEELGKRQTGARYAELQKMVIQVLSQEFTPPGTEASETKTEVTSQK